jgi:hypothetical protein
MGTYPSGAKKLFSSVSEIIAFLEKEDDSYVFHIEDITKSISLWGRPKKLLRTLRDIDKQAPIIDVTIIKLCEAETDVSNRKRALEIFAYSVQNETKMPMENETGRCREEGRRLCQTSASTDPAQLP